MINIIYLLMAQIGVLLAFYLLSLRLKKGDLADFAWTLFVFSWSVLTFLESGIYSLRNFLIFGLTFFWTFRLGKLILFGRILKKGEDTRYAHFRKQWKSEGAEYWKFGVLFGIQIFFAGALALPFHFMYGEVELQLLDLIGIVVFLIGFGGVYLSDYQLAKFKSDPENHGEVCKVGLWSYSRHPNYFFESVLWFSYPFFTVHSPYWPFCLISPLLMLILLLFVTGVPTSERQALKSKGDKYRQYQKRVSKFFPWPPS